MRNPFRKKEVYVTRQGYSLYCKWCDKVLVEDVRINADVDTPCRHCGKALVEGEKDAS